MNGYNHLSLQILTLKKKVENFQPQQMGPPIRQRGATVHGMFQPSSPTASQRFLISPAWRYLDRKMRTEIFGEIQFFDDFECEIIGFN